MSQKETSPDWTHLWFWMVWRMGIKSSIDKKIPRVQYSRKNFYDSILTIKYSNVNWKIKEKSRKNFIKKFIKKIFIVDKKRRDIKDIKCFRFSTFS